MVECGEICLMCRAIVYLGWVSGGLGPSVLVLLLFISILSVVYAVPQSSLTQPSVHHYIIFYSLWLFVVCYVVDVKWS